MTERLNTIRKVIQRLTLSLCFCGMFLLIPMMLLPAGDVIGRVVWSRPVPGAVEVSSYMLAVFILLGVAYTHQVKGHVRTDKNLLFCGASIGKNELCVKRKTDATYCG